MQKGRVKRIQQSEYEEMYGKMISSEHGITFALVNTISYAYVPRVYGKDGCLTLVSLYTMLRTLPPSLTLDLVSRQAPAMDSRVNSLDRVPVIYSLKSNQADEYKLVLASSKYSFTSKDNALAG